MTSTTTVSAEPPVDYEVSNSSTGALYQSLAGANSLLDNYLLVLLSQSVVITCCDLLHPLLTDMRSATLQGALRVLAHVTKFGLPLLDRLLAFVMLPDLQQSPKASSSSRSEASSFSQSSFSSSVASTTRDANSFSSPIADSKSVRSSRRVDTRDEGKIWCSFIKKNLHNLTFEGVGRGRGPGAYKARMLIRKVSVVLSITFFINLVS
jgi:hypothetical protein